MDGYLSPGLVAGRAAASIEDQWRQLARPAHTTGSFDRSTVAMLPEPARRWLNHAIVPGTRLSSTVLLSMRGRFRLGSWLPIQAVQVLSPPAGLVWAARIGWGPLSFRGFDSYGEGRGEMSWRLVGRIPVVHADGDDIDQSAAGRLVGESIWAPASFLGPHVSWRANPDPDTATAVWTIGPHVVSADLLVAEDGALRAIKVSRLGNPGKKPWGEYPFGGAVDREAAFDGFRIPTAMAVGWLYGTDQFAEGEFFRLEITRAQFL